MSPQLNVCLLGTPLVERGREPLAVDTRKAIALLAYLALANPGGRHSRDSLAALFWPEVEPSRAHGALRRTLSSLNKALAGPWLRIERDALSFGRRGQCGREHDEERRGKDTKHGSFAFPFAGSRALGKLASGRRELTTGGRRREGRAAASRRFCHDCEET